MLLIGLIGMELSMKECFHAIMDLTEPKAKEVADWIYKRVKESRSLPTREEAILKIKETISAS